MFPWTVDDGSKSLDVSGASWGTSARAAPGVTMPTTDVDTDVEVRWHRFDFGSGWSPGHSLPFSKIVNRRDRGGFSAEEWFDDEETPNVVMRRVEDLRLVEVSSKTCEHQQTKHHNYWHAKNKKYFLPFGPANKHFSVIAVYAVFFCWRRVFGSKCRFLVPKFDGGSKLIYVWSGQVRVVLLVSNP